ncbi:MAG: hypothetical protein R3192_05125 [Woeseiaceae bacterium]|nr:hypothetical protein [Woeseiaceae bacterium]
MTILIAAVVVFGILTILFFLHMFRCLGRRKIVRAGASGLTCCAAAGISGGAALLLFTILSYARLVEEQLVSHIEFRRISPQEFQARLSIEGEKDQFFVLRGDEWQMDAKILTWQPPATILGLDPMYQLDRLSGRYSEVDRERSEVRTVHSLAPPAPVDVWRLARRFPMLAPGIDAYYGTATYVPMADGARYAVSLSRDALIARPVNDAARQAVGNWAGN